MLFSFSLSNGSCLVGLWSSDLCVVGSRGTHTEHGSRDIYVWYMQIITKNRRLGKQFKLWINNWMPSKKCEFKQKCALIFISSYGLHMGWMTGLTLLGGFFSVCVWLEWNLDLKIVGNGKKNMLFGESLEVSALELAAGISLADSPFVFLVMEGLSFYAETGMY